MPQGNDPHLIEAQIKSIQSAIISFSRDADKVLPKIEDENVRRFLAFLKGEIDLINTLLQVALIPYLQTLDERIEEDN